MGHPQLSIEEIARRGEEVYARSIRDQVEADAENIGKILVLDIETGAYEIDDVGLVAAHRLKAKHPDATLYTLRIGYDAVYALGGSLTRTKQ